MRSHRTAAVALIALLATLIGASDRPGMAPPEREPGDGGGRYPSEWFYTQRAFPGGTIDPAAYDAALAEAGAQRETQARATRMFGVSAVPLVWSQAGPYNIGGRVSALASTPGGTTIYLGAANGGLFKSTNSGVNWTPIFDNGFSTFSIGALTLDPTRDSTIYAGTGEANSSVDSYDGSGLYRSLDAGATWSYSGLAATRRIARVAVDPANPQRLFVAAMGSQFSTGPDRGLYRSEDGGATWAQVLFVSDSTGASDVVINPAHPETVFCATWERVRHHTYRRAFGPECGIWRSADHGTTWTRLSTGLPAPSDNVGRIGLAIAPSRPSTVYAQIGSGSALGYIGLGLYRSLDGGATWTRRDGTGTTSTFNTAFGGFCWYFGDMAVSPTDPERIFCLGQSLIRSINGGTTFSNVTGLAHVDEHAMWIDPSNPNRIYLGSDGGFFWSANGSGTWQKSVDLPITQFYACTVDPANPARLVGGTQDNNSIQTVGSPTGWGAILGGDGFYAVVDHTNSNITFAEYQFCCGGTGPQRSTNGGGTFFTPTGFVGSDRYNWSTPIVMSPQNHNLLLTGSQRVYRSLDNGISYATISGDLTTNPPSLLGFGTISTLDISPADGNLFYVGTDDGKVWRSDNQGGVWIDITAGLPLRSITRVTADPLAPDVVYVTLSGFGSDESAPHVFRSANRGATWSSISGDLPNAPANDVLVDPLDPNTLYLGTDVGVYATRNLGVGWFPLGTGMPVQTVFDLALHPASRTLVAGTHGRSAWKLDLNQLPVSVGDANKAPRLALSVPMPNPSRGRAQVTLDLPGAARVDIAVFDAAGRRVTTLLEGDIPAGRRSLIWDGTDARGRRVNAGVYWMRASTNNSRATQRVVRLD